MLNLSSAVKIEPLSLDDVNGVLEVQKLCGLSESWKQPDYERLAADPRAVVLVAGLENCAPREIVGFSIAYHLDREAELWNIAVTPRFRRQGIAKSLLRETCRRLGAAGAERLFLEVRSSNTPAVELYQALGFSHLSTRKEYYGNPTEDAVVLVCELTPTEV